MLIACQKPYTVSNPMVYTQFMCKCQLASVFPLGFINIANSFISLHISNIYSYVLLSYTHTESRHSDSMGLSPQEWHFHGIPAGQCRLFLLHLS